MAGFAILALWLPPGGAVEVALGVDHTTRWVEGEQASGFELGRAEVGGRWDWAWLTSEARFEAVRSARPQSLFGVDGNSLVVRARRVWVGAEVPWGPLVVAGQAGLVGDAFLEAAEQGDDLRDLTVLSAQGSGVLDAADLGARVRVGLANGRLTLETSLVNGEGATEVERNDGTDIAVQLAGVPWAGRLGDAPAAVRLAAFWRDGSRGAGAVQNDRIGALATARGGLGSLGVVVVRADGFAERAQRQVTEVEAWVNATVWPGYFGLLGQYGWSDLDEAAADAVRQRVSAGLYLEPALPGSTADQRLRLYLTWSHMAYGADASPVAGVPEAVAADVIGVRLAWTRTQALEASP